MRATRDGEVTTTELHLEEGSRASEPAAPGTVWSDERQRVLDVHRLLALRQDKATFESYGLGEPLPEPGGHDS